MKSELKIVTDPVGNDLIFDTILFKQIEKEKTFEVINEIYSVIEKPALLLELTIESDFKELYYFRSLNWQKTILVTAHYINGNWSIYKFIFNPSNEILSKLLQNGKHLI